MVAWVPQDGIMHCGSDKQTICHVRRHLGFDLMQLLSLYDMWRTWHSMAILRPTVSFAVRLVFALKPAWCMALVLYKVVHATAGVLLQQRLPPTASREQPATKRRCSVVRCAYLSIKAGTDTGRNTPARVMGCWQCGWG